MELRTRLHNLICLIAICVAVVTAVSCRTAPDPEPSPDAVEVQLPAAGDLPDAPTLTIDPAVPFLAAVQLRTIIEEHTGVDWLAEDAFYFVPTEENMDTVIRYLDDCFQHFGITYVLDGTDCDDFARTKVGLVRIILGQAYSRHLDPPMEASPTVFVIFVKQDKSWARVPAGGAHAAVVYACVDRSGKTHVRVWEPQSTETIAAKDYPNRRGVFYVGQKATKD